MKLNLLKKSLGLIFTCSLLLGVTGEAFAIKDDNTEKKQSLKREPDNLETLEGNFVKKYNKIKEDSSNDSEEEDHYLGLEPMDLSDEELNRILPPFSVFNDPDPQLMLWDETISGVKSKGQDEGVLAVLSSTSKPICQKPTLMVNPLDNTTTFHFLNFSDELLVHFMQYPGVAISLGSVCKKLETLRTDHAVPLCTVFKTKESVEEYFKVRRLYPKMHYRFKHDPKDLFKLILGLYKHQYPRRSLDIDYDLDVDFLNSPSLYCLNDAQFQEVSAGIIDFRVFALLRENGINLLHFNTLNATQSDLISMPAASQVEQSLVNSLESLMIVSDSDDQIVPQICKFPLLRKLDLFEGESNITYDGFNTLFFHLTNLKKFSIGPGLYEANNIAELLAEHLPGLEGLELWGVGNAGMRHIVKLTNLKKLLLAGNDNGELDDESAPEIGKLTKLTCLDLQGNKQFTDNCFAHFKTLTQLDYIFMGEDEDQTVSDEAVEQFMDWMEENKAKREAAKLTK